MIENRRIAMAFDKIANIHCKAFPRFKLLRAKAQWFLALLICFAVPATGWCELIEVVPDSYVSPVASSSYPDNTGSELTDETYGGFGWRPNDPNDPWVGWWGTSQFNIDFDLGTQESISIIRVASLQHYNANISLPDIQLFADKGTGWELLHDKIAHPITDGLFTYEYGDLDATATLYRLSITPDPQYPGNTWTFLSEVDFFTGQAEPIPEPTTICLMGFGLLSVLGVVIRQRRKKK